MSALWPDNFPAYFCVIICTLNQIFYISQFISWFYWFNLFLFKIELKLIFFISSLRLEKGRGSKNFEFCFYILLMYVD